MKTQRPTILPFAIATLSAVSAFYIGWQLVRGDAVRWARAGYSIGPELKFVIFFGMIPGIVIFTIARRLLYGPAMRCNSWNLTVPMLPQQESGYRESKGVMLADLITRLEARGYRLISAAVDVDGNQIGPIDAQTLLSGIAVSLTDSRLGAWQSKLVLRISALTAQSAGLGAIETIDVRRLGYQELATFVIAELNVLIRGVQYKLSDSSLSADPASELSAVLPEYPLQLPARSVN